MTESPQNSPPPPGKTPFAMSTCRRRMRGKPSLPRDAALPRRCIVRIVCRAAQRQGGQGLADAATLLGRPPTSFDEFRQAQRRPCSGVKRRRRSLTVCADEGATMSTS